MNVQSVRDGEKIQIFQIRKEILKEFWLDLT